MEHYSESQFEKSRLSEELSAILHTPLSAETIDTYADIALTKLIDLIARTTLYYEAQPTIRFTSTRDTENAAFGYVELQHVEEILDYIAGKADEIHSLDGFIGTIPTDTYTLLPPEETGRHIADGEGAWDQEKQLAPRLKTLLFILANEYSVDVHDPTQLAVMKGTNDPTMMRSESYYLTHIPQLERTVLVNDEVGNATFILDSSLLEKTGLAISQLINLTKADLTALLEDHPRLGQRLIYSDHYVTDLIAALRDPATKPAEVAAIPEAASFLIPKLPEDYLTATGLASALGVGIAVVKKTISELSDELGEVPLYRSTSATKAAPGFSPEQQALITQRIETRGFLSKPPEGYHSVPQFAAILGVSGYTLRRAIMVLAPELGTIDKHAYRSVSADSLAPAQQNRIEQYLQANDYFSEPPEGYINQDQLMKLLHADHRWIKRAIEEIGEPFGEVRTFKFHKNSKRTAGYSPEQQAILMRHFHKQ